MVVARSFADIPVVVPVAESTDTVNAVDMLSELPSEDTINGSSSFSAVSEVIETQMIPDVWLMKNAIDCCVATSAAIIRSPSFSRDSSSSTTTGCPFFMASNASGMLLNPAAGCARGGSCWVAAVASPRVVGKIYPMESARSMGSAGGSWTVIVVGSARVFGGLKTPCLRGKPTDPFSVTAACYAVATH